MFLFPSAFSAFPSTSPSTCSLQQVQGRPGNLRAGSAVNLLSPHLHFYQQLFRLVSKIAPGALASGDVLQDAPQALV